MHARTFCTIAALLLSALAGEALPAGTLYDNLTNTTIMSVPVALVGPLYDSFSTGASAFSLNDVQLKLRIAEPVFYRRPLEAPRLLQVGYWRPVAQVRSKPSRSGLRPRDGGGLMTVALYADSSTSPGVLLTTIGTLPGDSLSMTLANYDFPLGSAYPLLTNQRYWIGISTSNGSIAGWAKAQNNTGLGVANEFWYANGMVHPNADPPFQMQVNGLGGPAATPAPSSWLLLLVGLAGLGLFAGRKKFGVSR